VTSDGFGALRLAAPPAGFLPALRRNSASLREASLRLGAHKPLSYIPPLVP